MGASHSDMEFAVRALIPAIVCAVLTVAAPMASAAASAEATSQYAAVQVAPDVALETTSYDYYRNYFYSLATCRSRGGAMTNPGSSQYAPGIIGYYGHRHVGEAKWSMDVYWL